MRTVIAIALHKPAPLPTDSIYLPVQAGAAIGSPIAGLIRDDGGTNISRKNPMYCELTVHYWMHRQIDADIYGLCHYRRFFTHKAFSRSPADAVTNGQLSRLMQDTDVIVPYPRLYLIETNYSQFAHAHRASDLDLAREVIAGQCPAYLTAFDRVMKRRWGRRFNMFIMRREAFEQYSQWLFGVLFEMEKRLGEDAPERVMGHVAERLMDVWLEQTQPRIRHLHVIHTESQHWPRKVAVFLLRKLTGGRIKMK